MPRKFNGAMVAHSLPDHSDPGFRLHTDKAHELLKFTSQANKHVRRKSLIAQKSELSRLGPRVFETNPIVHLGDDSSSISWAPPEPLVNRKSPKDLTNGKTRPQSSDPQK